MSIKTAEHGASPPPVDEQASEPVSSTRVIPPPPLKGNVSELRLKHMTLSSELPPYVWGQADAFDIPRDAAPPSDLSEIRPELRETARPGRFCA